MPLEDVSHDICMVDWLRRGGHGHLLDEHNQSYPMRPSISPPPPIPPRDYNRIDPYCDSYNRSMSFSRNENFNTLPYNPSYRPDNFITSPTEFLAPHTNPLCVDRDVEAMRYDPNTRVVQRPAQDDVLYKQRVFVRYLQPPTPPVSGAIIVREKQLPPPPPEPPLVIKRAPPPPPTPPPITIRERPPPMPPPEGTTVINKVIPPPAKPPRQVIVEQYPQLPPKPQDVIIERWLPVKQRQRRIFYERAPANPPTSTGPMIVQYGQPQIRIQREIRTEPCAQYTCQPVSCHSNIKQHICSTVSPSSLMSYNPCSTLQPSKCCTCQSQSKIVMMQKQQPCARSVTCVCSSKSTTGLGGYGCSIPTISNCGGQTTVYSVPENVPINNVIRQFGIDPCCIQPPTNMIACM
ncbi:unnamed protein product [Rotaria sp. Silwood1]|nr:unnamed protein product [Rotaria sp. Silwood1]CAF1228950.1 unnamed protein product [Rotaria sp. Silwood1]CAF3470788.1 unnamed protein product [Rotaria sp. Silwood1]CAF3490694.1 unnamed protein product [Rotaria sp. Silwood1]CAF4644746.1 unnamed protein product [Rotaria sp. Silwood1]